MNRRTPIAAAAAALGHRAHGTLDATRPGGPLGRHLTRKRDPR